MRYVIFVVALYSFCGPLLAQTAAPSNEELLSKARALYDAPFERNLGSFDCAVQFDWTQHFLDLLGVVPPAFKPTVERLQTIPHRIFVDRSGAVVSAQPKAPDLTGVLQATVLEEGFKALVPAGINAWLPASTNVILPVGPTKYSFQKIDPGYKLVMNGPGIAATLLLANDLRVTSAVSELPAMRATTEFTPGPDGFVLSFLRLRPRPTRGQRARRPFHTTTRPFRGFNFPLRSQ